MNRESEADLLDFCVRQHQEFEGEAWLTRTNQNRDELATAALFLAGVVPGILLAVFLSVYVMILAGHYENREKNGQ